MSLAITAVSTTAFRLPMRGELRWGKHGRLHTLEHVLIQVRLTDGSTGLAEAPPRPTIYGETVASIESIVATELSPRLVGLPVERAATVLQEIKNNQTARGAIDMAIHDAVAQSRGLSLAEYLGCTQERLRVSYILGMGDRDTVLTEAEQVVAQGVPRSEGESRP